jgi:hypothetical protein
VLRQLQIQVGGQAAAAEQAGLGFGRLRASLGDVQEEIGKRLAPAIKIVVSGITSLLEKAKENEALLDFAVALGAGVAAASALVALAAPLVGAFTAISAGLAAAGVAGTALTGILFGIPAALAVVVGGAVFLALNWEASMNRIRAATASVVTFISESFGSAFTTLSELFSGRIGFAEAFQRLVNTIPTATQAAMVKYNAVLAEGQKEAEKTVAASEEKQNAEKKAAADRAAAEKRAQESREQATQKAVSELKLAQLRQESQETIALKQQEISILKDLEKEKNVAVIAAANERLAELQVLQEEQAAIDTERAAEFELQKQAVLAELKQEGYNVDNALAEQQLNLIRQQKQTEAQIEIEEARNRLSQRIAANNLYLAEQKKFGVAYATINLAMHSAIYQGTKTAFGELAALQQSSNSTLKAIGKAAAIANIIIKTSESAMNIYAGFSTIPIVGPALGIAGAAAAVAFGGEQLSRVTAAASGALVGGTGSGDTQPFMLEPGELVSPKRNFNEVVSGVQTERSGIIDEVRGQLAELAGRPSSNTVVNINGDVLAEESYIDRLVRGVSDAVEFRNARLFGVTT